MVKTVEMRDGEVRTGSGCPQGFLKPDWRKPGTRSRKVLSNNSRGLPMELWKKGLTLNVILLPQPFLRWCVQGNLCTKAT